MAFTSADMTAGSGSSAVITGMTPVSAFITSDWETSCVELPIFVKM